MYKLLVIGLMCIYLVLSEDSNKKCGDNLECIEDEMIELVDTLEKKESLPVFGDAVRLEKTKDVKAPENENIVERCIRYLSNHELRVGIPSRSARSLVEEARGGKIRKLLLPLLLLLKLGAAAIVPAILSAIALVAFTGMGSGVLALVIAGATAFKAALENTGSKLTYEVVPQLGSPHWSRLGVDPLANQGYHTIV